MIADAQQITPQRTATLSALQFQTANIVPKMSISVSLSGHGQTVSLVATLGRCKATH